MHDERFAFLKDLVEAPSPSGYEGPARTIWRREVEGTADEVRTDLHGNTIAALNPGGAPRVMLAGHVDEIGLMITYVDDDGFAYFGPIGGHDPVIMPGQRVYVHTASGPLLGVIGRRPIHMMHGDERDKKVELHDLWIDLGAASRDAVTRRVQVGDAVTLAVGLDHPGASGDKKRYGDVRLGRGPVISRGPSINPVVFRRLVDAATSAGIPYQVEPNPSSSGTDADAMQRSRGGVATAVISVALRYMHTPVEMLELADIDRAIDLLTEFVVRLEQDTDFTP